MLLLAEFGVVNRHEVLAAAGELVVEPAEEALLIGDSANDVKAARAAGFRIVCVTYGYNHGQDIRASNPDALVDSLAELPDIFGPRDHVGTGDGSARGPSAPTA